MYCPVCTRRTTSPSPKYKPGKLEPGKGITTTLHDFLGYAIYRGHTIPDHPNVLRYEVVRGREVQLGNNRLLDV